MELVTASEGARLLLLGNEAIVRGALEAGVDFVTTYPGTPASEIGDTFAGIADQLGIYFEYSVNEKVALDMGIGAAASGLRVLTAMKHVGVNVASDAINTLAYTGVKGGYVIVVADDPNCHSSQNEQDTRLYAAFASVPMFEPSTPQECLEMVREAFSLSERLGIPVILRTTTRVSHTRAPVIVGKRPTGHRSGSFKRGDTQFISLPAMARRHHRELLTKLASVAEYAETSPSTKLLRAPSPTKLGIITSSAAATHVREALDGLGLQADVLKLGLTHPLPRWAILSFLQSHEKTAIIEELEPYLEERIRAIAQEAACDAVILGKSTGAFPRTGELNIDLVKAGLAAHLGLTLAAPPPRPAILDHLPARPPILCAGCPHAASFYAVRSAIRKRDAILASDIGCYSLGAMAPVRAGDLMIAMGTGIGAAGGFARATNKPVIAYIGDSTFYHAGIPALINAVHNRHQFVLIILDNRTTAMTGHQPHAGSEINWKGEEAPAVSMEALARACGVRHVRTIDPYEPKEMRAAVEEALAQSEVSVLIARRACALLAINERAGKPFGPPYEISDELCRKCGICVTRFGCPAIYQEGKTFKIDPARCVSCGVCAVVCPFEAIGVAG